MQGGVTGAQEQRHSENVKLASTSSADTTYEDRRNENSHNPGRLVAGVGVAGLKRPAEGDLCAQARDDADEELDPDSYVLDDGARARVLAQSSSSENTCTASAPAESQMDARGVSRGQEKLKDHISES